jgi:hypothetical protein
VYCLNLDSANLHSGKKQIFPFGKLANLSPSAPDDVSKRQNFVSKRQNFQNFTQNDTKKIPAGYYPVGIIKNKNLKVFRKNPKLFT